MVSDVIPPRRPRFDYDDRMFTLRELLLYGLRGKAEAEALVEAVAQERDLDLKEALPFYVWYARPDVMAALGDAVMRTVHHH